MMSQVTVVYPEDNLVLFFTKHYTGQNFAFKFLRLRFLRMAEIQEVIISNDMKDSFRSYDIDLYVSRMIMFLKNVL